MAKALDIYMGQEAAARIAKEGWTAELFSLLLGASGGPKWFILGHLDRVLFGDFLQGTDQPLSVMGSSIGSWRHACLAMPDPAEAIGRLEQGYMYQRYASKPTAMEVSEVSSAILDTVLGAQGGAHLVNHPRIHTHIVTARGRGPTGSSSMPLLASGMGAAALCNTVSRSLLNLHFQRVVFHSGQSANPQFDLQDFQTHYCALREDSVRRSLHASGAIPFVLAGENNIPGAPPGQYWDGGIIDYHFDLDQFCGDGLILYPHFSDTIIPGWFDKFLPWRKTTTHSADKLVMLCPSREFTADLPKGKIPDRSDFTRLPEEERIRYWEESVERSRALAEEFQELIARSDPLEDVTVFN
jgi:hypothetical protein